ncbi:hypothetical protein IQ07DRAFT_379518 [Pyrenochaeta sp. DS3sAY3a]|nr:hypothetical protein IQ07DRAFT_379518 [Pyrenochaeta sp. DS3sAY3a]
MRPRLYAHAAFLRGTLPYQQSPLSMLRLQVSRLVCRNCQKKFSTTSRLRLPAQSTKNAAKSSEKDRMYNSKLLIYDAGDVRTTWITFWKAVALLQFGTTLVFGVPPLWNNENQPDPNLRKFQAVLVGVLGTIPTLTLAYVTAPFVHQVFIQIPDHARRSRKDLMHFARSLNANSKATANTKLEFVTLRVFPFRKHTTAFVHELRALPPMKMRLANIELPKSDEWVKRQRAKGIFMRMFDVMNEPRFKFYVKEGRVYTMKTRVPGVWEEVAQRIAEQTKVEQEETEKARVSTSRRPIIIRPPVKLAARANSDSIRRQTSRLPPR